MSNDKTEQLTDVFCPLVDAAVQFEDRMPNLAFGSKLPVPALTKHKDPFQYARNRIREVLSQDERV